MDDIKETLESRGDRYGDFKNNAVITGQLCNVLRSAPNYYRLSHTHREAYHMIFHKISRSACGDPYYIDNIHDLIGYATLLEEYIATAIAEGREELRGAVHGE